MLGLDRYSNVLFNFLILNMHITHLNLIHPSRAIWQGFCLLDSVWMFLELRLTLTWFPWLPNLIDSLYWHLPERIKRYDPHEFILLYNLLILSFTLCILYFVTMFWYYMMIDELLSFYYHSDHVLFSHFYLLLLFYFIFKLEKHTRVSVYIYNVYIYNNIIIV